MNFINNMKRFYKLFLATLILLLINSISFAQDTEVKKSSLDVGVDMVNRYVWRGLSLSATPNIQPNITFTNANESFSIGAWGSYSNSTNFGEIDLFASYSFSYFTLSVWDYFVMDETAIENGYFKYKNDTTGHAYEASLVLGDFSIPLQITSSVFFYGADKDDNGDNYYSLYFELSYEFNIADHDLNVFIGGTPMEGMYATGPGIINVGCSLSKEINITDNFNIPFMGSLIFNPRDENVFFVIGITF